MEAIVLLLSQVIPPLIQLGINVAPYVAAASDSVNALVTGNHITPEQEAALRSQISALEAQWADVVKAAEAEAAVDQQAS